MASMAIRDPRIAQGFSTLAQAFFPNPANVAKMQLAAAQRDMMLARAGVYDAQSSQTWNDVDAARTQAQIMASPNWTGDQNSVARLFAQEAMRAKRDPGFITAARVGVNPNALTPSELSNILAANGQNYATTPQGVQDGLINQQVLANIQTDGRVSAAEARANAIIERQRLANEGNLGVAGVRADASRDVANIRTDGALERQSLANEGNLGVAGVRADATRDAAKTRADAQTGAANIRANTPGRPGAVPTLSATELGRLQQQVLARMGSILRDQYGLTIKNPADLQLDADFQTRLFGDLANEYQRTKNADAAVQTALRNNPITANNIQRLDSRLNPFSNHSVRVGRDQTAGMPTNSAAGALGAAAGEMIGRSGPAAPAAPATGLQSFGDLPDGTIIRHKVTGQLMRIQNGQPMPIQGAGQ